MRWGTGDAEWAGAGSYDGRVSAVDWGDHRSAGIIGSIHADISPQVLRVRSRVRLFHGYIDLEVCAAPEGGHPGLAGVVGDVETGADPDRERALAGGHRAQDAAVRHGVGPFVGHRALEVDLQLGTGGDAYLPAVVLLAEGHRLGLRRTSAGTLRDRRAGHGRHRAGRQGGGHGSRRLARGIATPQ